MSAEQTSTLESIRRIKRLALDMLPSEVPAALRKIVGECIKLEAKLAACDRPPCGWRCTRAAGHKGACAAQPDETSDGAEVLGYVRKADVDAFPPRHAILACISEGDWTIPVYLSAKKAEPQSMDDKTNE